MSTSVLSQAAWRVDLEWEYGDPVSLDFVLEEYDVSGTYECVIRDAETGGRIIAQPTVTATYIPNDGTRFQIQMTALEAVEIPIGRWWYSIQETLGVTRFAGRVQIVDSGHKSIAYVATLDTNIVLSAEVEDVTIS